MLVMDGVACERETIQSTMPLILPLRTSYLKPAIFSSKLDEVCWSMSGQRRLKTSINEVTEQQSEDMTNDDDDKHEKDGDDTYHRLSTASLRHCQRCERGFHRLPVVQVELLGRGWCWCCLTQRANCRRRLVAPLSVRFSRRQNSGTDPTEL